MLHQPVHSAECTGALILALSEICTQAITAYIPYIFEGAVLFGTGATVGLITNSLLSKFHNDK